MKYIFIKAVLTATAMAIAGSVAAQDRILKFALNGPDGHPAVVGMKKFKESVEAKSGGKLKINLYLNGTLGGDQAVLSAVQGGTVEMSVMNSGILSSVAKELAIFDFPFLFGNEKESDAIVDGPIGKRLHALLDPKGVVGLSYWELGYRQVTNSKRALNRVEDIEGLKLRVIPSPINVDWVKALGANPVPMPFPEVYAAMESKAIDGHENPISVIAASKFWEVQKYVAMTNHQYNPQSVIFSKKIWDNLSGAEKKIIEESAEVASKVQREAARAAVASNLEILKKNGMTVTQFSPAEVAKLREKMKPIIAKYAANVGENTINDVMSELANMRK